jgi:hypothetical protein
MFYLFLDTPCAACGQSHALVQPFAADAGREVDCRYTCPVKQLVVGLRRPVRYEVVLELPADAILMEPVPHDPPAPVPSPRLSHH